MAGSFWLPNYWIGEAGSGGSGSPPATATLSVVDNGDDTGATATISAADGGTTNTVYVAPIDGDFSAGNWVSAGSRIGNGEVDLDIEAGHYFGVVVSATSGGASVSLPVYFVVTTGVDSVHYRALEATVSRLIMLGMDGIDDANILLRNRANNRFVGPGKEWAYPAVVVSIYGSESASLTEGTTFADDTGYPVLVVILDKYPESLEPQPNHLKWREQIHRAFHNQRLTGVAEVMHGRFDPGMIVSPSDWPGGVFRSHLGFRFFARQSRGLT